MIINLITIAVILERLLTYIETSHSTHSLHTKQKGTTICGFILAPLYDDVFLVCL